MRSGPLLSIRVPIQCTRPNFFSFLLIFSFSLSFFWFSLSLCRFLLSLLLSFSLRVSNSRKLRARARASSTSRRSCPARILFSPSLLFCSRKSAVSKELLRNCCSTIRGKFNFDQRPDEFCFQTANTRNSLSDFVQNSSKIVNSK